MVAKHVHHANLWYRRAEQIWTLLVSAGMPDIAYDKEGQLLTGSFMDYAMPRADDLPNIDVEFKGGGAGINYSTNAKFTQAPLIGAAVR